MNHLQSTFRTSPNTSREYTISDSVLRVHEYQQPEYPVPEQSVTSAYPRARGSSCVGPNLSRSSGVRLGRKPA